MPCPECATHERRLNLAKQDLQRHLELCQEGESNDYWVEASELHVKEVEQAYERHLRKDHR